MAAKRKRRSTDPATIAATIADRDTSIQSCFRTTKGNAQPIKKVTVKTPPNPRFKPPTGVKCAANGIARVDSGNAISKLLLRHSSSSSSTTSCTDSVEEVELLPEERGLQNQPESNWRDNAGIGTQSDSVFLGYPPEKKPRTAWTPTRPPLAVESFGVTSTLLCSTGECVGSLEECDRRANHIENQFLTASDVMRTRQEISPGSSFSQFGNIGYDEIAEMESREVEAARMLALKVTPDNSKPAHPGQNLDHQRSKLKIVRKPAGHNVRRSQTLGPHFHALQKADHENVGGEPLLGDTENVSLEVSRSEHYPHKESVDQTSVLLKDAPASVTDTVNVPGDEEWPFISDSLLSESQSTSPILISKDAVPGSLTSSLSVRPPQFLTSSPGEAHVGNICPPSRELAAETKPGDLSDQTLSLVTWCSR
ncbi:hypothetical protein DFJ77DRAFT_455935 [Powellomyces hirtus]|nr:hypothetical protein DFJ77DRAFT_455935 [Powellomyces hirtus]